MPNGPIMFGHVPAQVTRYGLVCFIDLIEMGLNNLIAFDGLLIWMDHFGTTVDTLTLIC